MDYKNSLLLVDIDQYVATVTLNRPPLNILTLPLSNELRDTFHKLEEDDSVRVIILTGSGQRAFCVGADIKEFPEVWDDVIGKKLLNENLAINAVELINKPVIAAIEGNVLGGGCELALACDIRVMSETGKIGLPEINLGVFPGSGGLFRLARYVGISTALELLYTGDIISAQHAQSIGLVNHITNPGESLDVARLLAHRIAKKPFEAIQLIKQGVREMWQKTTAENFQPNLDFSKAIFKTEDCQEGVDAFINKRTPKFK